MGAAEAYIALGETENASDVLKQGLETTANRGVARLLESLETTNTSIPKFTPIITAPHDVNNNTNNIYNPQIGNSNSNIYNRGKMVSDSEWIYYVDTALSPKEVVFLTAELMEREELFYNADECIYRMSADRSKIEELYRGSGEIWSLNIYDGKLYFRDIGLVTLNSDGSTTQITPNRDDIGMSPTGSFIIFDGWIYFYSANIYMDALDADIWKMRIDGSETSFVGKSGVGAGVPGRYTLAYDDGYIYSFLTLQNSMQRGLKKEIIRISVTTGEREVIDFFNDDDDIVLLVENGWIYYYKRRDGMLSRIRPDGSVNEDIALVYFNERSFISIDGDNVFLSMASNSLVSPGIYEIDTTNSIQNNPVSLYLEGRYSYQGYYFENVYPQATQITGLCIANGWIRIGEAINADNTPYSQAMVMSYEWALAIPLDNLEQEELYDKHINNHDYKLFHNMVTTYNPQLDLQLWVRQAIALRERCMTLGTNFSELLKKAMNSYAWHSINYDLEVADVPYDLHDIMTEQEEQPFVISEFSSWLKTFSDNYPSNPSILKSMTENELYNIIEGLQDMAQVCIEGIEILQRYI